MACTVAVEDTIVTHYTDQIREIIEQGKEEEYTELLQVNCWNIEIMNKYYYCIFHVSTKFTNIRKMVEAPKVLKHCYKTSTMDFLTVPSDSPLKLNLLTYLKRNAISQIVITNLDKIGIF